ncbi:MAG TPA: hypothetical protein VJA21_32565 [Verrucomicrobiae bacterium]
MSIWNIVSTRNITAIRNLESTSTSTRGISRHKGLCLGAVGFAIALLVVVFNGAVLNACGKAEARRIVARAHPGSVLRISRLDYSVWANRLVAHSVALSGTTTTIKADRIALTGVRWPRLLWRPSAPADAFAKASLEATNVDVEFPSAHYGLRCARLQASVPGSELVAEDSELRTLAGDEQFFAAHAFRTTRFHVVAPECRVSGLAFGELLQGKSYRARSITFSRPSFDALVNCDQPAGRAVQTPPMVHEALTAVRRPLQIDSLNITNGHLAYCERVVAGTAPGVLTVAAVNMFVEGIANHGGASAAIRLQARGNLMGAGTLTLAMSIPITPRDFSLHYCGSLGAMDLTRLNGFLETAEHTRITSGSAKQAAFEIDVAAGRARGRVRGAYENLVIAVLDKTTGDEKGLANRAVSFFENVVKIRKSNVPDESGAMREGKVDYTRKTDDRFVEFLWFALRTGVMDLISR